MRDAETIIVGGGPAGSSCARELIRRGRSCLVLERQEIPRPKLCAGWITPKVLSDLEIGPGEYPHGMVKLGRMRVYWGRSPFSVEFPTEQYSIRRREFDAWLLRRAGAEVVRHQVRSIALERGWYVIDGAFRCRYLIGAGGTQCPVKRALFGADNGRLILTREVEYAAEPKDAVCTLFYPFASLAGYAWYVPKAGAINVGYGGVASRLGADIKSLWDGFVRLLRRRGLIDSPPPEPSSHPYYLGDRKKPVRRGNAFIVGDAAGAATLDMGEGIGPAVESGILAARSILAQNTYEMAAIPERTLAGLPGRLMAYLVNS